ncbi:hypothetical protein [Arthrobacter polaris]|uniref:hypothetical protein n=1 Tax=Arthrobacter polaris TaxID=2813727 RepID=UPI001F1B6422|nr:hypothetical protein [Arthrobacter polaris]UIK89365.1 hypothetical protein J0916_02570 [Arthrobacter polaris]
MNAVQMRTTSAQAESQSGGTTVADFKSLWLAATNTAGHLTSLCRDGSGNKYQQNQIVTRN